MTSQPAAAGLYDEFPGYRVLTEAEYGDALQSALVVVDANVLLDLYRYNESTRDDLLDVLRQLGDRLWIPHQALREFWRNRISVITSRSASMEQTLTALTKQQHATAETIRQWAKVIAMEPPRRGRLQERIAGLYEELRAEITAHAPPVVTTASAAATEPVLGRLEILLAGKVGRALPAPEWEAAVKEGTRRAQCQEPPGYLDAEKAGSDLPEGPAGDYLVWRQALGEAARRGLDLLLVTGDEKEDWWWRYRGEFLGPRVELVDELKALCNRQLYLMRPIDLLKRAAVLDVTVHSQSVDDIERVSREQRLTVKHGRNELIWGLLAEAGLEILADWARLAKVGSYTEFSDALENRTGLPGFDFAQVNDRDGMAYLLELIVARSFPETNLLLSALVTYSGSSAPGPGFCKIAEDLGLLPPGASDEAKLRFWTQQVDALQNHYRSLPQ
jgi:hypothetical protein